MNKWLLMICTVWFLIGMLAGKIYEQRTHNCHNTFITMFDELLEEIDPIPTIQEEVRDTI